MAARTKEKNTKEIYNKQTTETKILRIWTKESAKGMNGRAREMSIHADIQKAKFKFIKNFAYLQLLKNIFPFYQQPQ